MNLLRTLTTGVISGATLATFLGAAPAHGSARDDDKVTLKGRGRAAKQVITCALAAANPHYSHHAHAQNRHRVNVVATVKCNRPIARMRIKVRLYKEGHLYKESGWAANAGKSTIRTNAARRCVAKQHYSARAWADLWAPPGYRPPTASLTSTSRTVYIAKCKKR